jgi:serine/threonine protein kinase
VQRLHILRGVAYGLLTLHLSDLVHLDVMPANITLHLSDLVHLDVMPANILLALLGFEIIACWCRGCAVCGSFCSLA